MEQDGTVSMVQLAMVIGMMSMGLGTEIIVIQTTTGQRSMRVQERHSVAASQVRSPSEQPQFAPLILRP